MKTPLLAGLFLCASVTKTLAQQRPEDVVRAFFKAEDEGRWLDAARMLDLSAFQRIRRSVVWGVRHRGEFAGPAVEEMMRMDPDMPRAVAEYQVQQSRREMRDYDYVAQEFARVTSVDTLEKLPLDNAAARWLEAKGPAWRTEIRWRDARARPKIDCPGMTDSASKALELKQAREPRAVIRGATPDTGRVSFVVVDVQFPHPVADSVRSGEPMARAIRLRRIGGDWKIDPAPDLPNSNGMGGSWAYSVSCRATGSGALLEKPPVK